MIKLIFVSCQEKKTKTREKRLTCAKLGRLEGERKVKTKAVVRAFSELSTAFVFAEGGENKIFLFRYCKINFINRN